MITVFTVCPPPVRSLVLFVLQSDPGRGTSFYCTSAAVFLFDKNSSCREPMMSSSEVGTRGSRVERERDPPRSTWDPRMPDPRMAQWDRKASSPLLEERPTGGPSHPSASGGDLTAPAPVVVLGEKLSSNLVDGEVVVLGEKLPSVNPAPLPKVKIFNLAPSRWAAFCHNICLLIPLLVLEVCLLMLWFYFIYYPTTAPTTQNGAVHLLVPHDGAVPQQTKVDLDRVAAAAITTLRFISLGPIAIALFLPLCSNNILVSAVGLLAFSIYFSFRGHGGDGSPFPGAGVLFYLTLNFSVSVNFLLMLELVAVIRPLRNVFWFLQKGVRWVLGWRAVAWWRWTRVTREVVTRQVVVGSGTE